MKVAIFDLEDFVFGKKNFFDPRLDELQELFKAKKTTPLQIEFISIDEIKDAEVVVSGEDKKLDLVLSDLEYVDDRLTKEIPPHEKELFEKSKSMLEQEHFLSSKLNQDELKILKGFPLLTTLPIYLLHAVDDVENQDVLGEIYSLSGRIFFFTAGEREARMWSIRRGETAWGAAGYIHSDIQQGFIRAEVVGVDELLAAGHYNQAKNEGKIRLENKEYIVKEGDVILFRFNK